MASSTLEGSGVRSPIKKSKAQLWNELKTASIVRCFTLIYTLALLTILTRVQLNLLGRQSYVSSVILIATSQSTDSIISLENHEKESPIQPEGVSFETNRNFLALSWWLLHKGWRDLMARVENAVKEVFGPLNPREEITFTRLAELIIDTRKKIEGATDEARRSQKWLPYLLPPADREAQVLSESGVISSNNRTSLSPKSPTSDPGITINTTSPNEEQAKLPNKENTFAEGPLLAINTSQPQDQTTQHNKSTSLVTPSLKRLLDETADIIDSPASTHTTTLLLDELFSNLTDATIRPQAFPAPQDSSLQPSILTPEQSPSKAKLATILAVATRQAHAIGNGVPNAYVQAMESVKELEALAAVVYSSNFDVGALGREAEVATEAAPANTFISGAELDTAYEEATAGAQSVGEATTERSGLVGATWGMFEGVWGKVTGSPSSARV